MAIWYYSFHLLLSWAAWMCRCGIAHVCACLLECFVVFFSLFRYEIVGALFFHLIHTKCDHMHINSDSIKSTDLCTFFDASFFSLSNSWLSFFYFAMNAFFFYLSPLCLRATSINISMCIVCVHFFSIQCTQPHAFAAGGHDFALNHWARSLYCTEVCNKFANSAPQNVK